MRGSLEDLEMKSVLEFFRANCQTGELIVAGDEGLARIQLSQGKVTRAELGDESGIAALLKVLDWREGEFEFRRETVSEDASPGADLLPAITLTRNDGPRSDGGISVPPSAATAKPVPELDTRMSARLCDALNASPSIWYLAVLAPDGTLRAEARCDLITSAGTGECQVAARSILQHYPQPRLERFMLEIPPLTVIAGRLPRGLWLLLAADRNALLGGTIRLHQKITESLVF